MSLAPAFIAALEELVRALIRDEDSEQVEDYLRVTEARGRLLAVLEEAERE